MKKKIKKIVKAKKKPAAIKKRLKVITEYHNKIEELTRQNSELTSKLEESQISIGQWQNKLYHTQAQHDALRVATAAMLEPFKNLLRQEAALFQAANTVWVDKFNDIESQMRSHHDLREELKIYDKQYIEVLKRLEKLEIERK